MMRVVLHRFLILVVTFSFCACKFAQENPIADHAVLGKLVDIRAIEVFFDAELTTAIPYQPSHALVIGSSRPYRLLLVDGRLGWAGQVAMSGSMPGHSGLRELKISPLTSAASLTPDPIHPAFGVANHLFSDSAKIVTASEQRFSETPQYILDQGRRIFFDDPKGFFYWPLLKIQDQTASGWLPATALVFRLADRQPLEMTGLVQKPFVALQAVEGALTVTVPQSFSYLDITDSIATTHGLDQPQTWTIEQVLLPPTDLDTGISSITLASSTNNCTLFFVKWRSQEKIQFGYCKHKEAAPTPLILGYRRDENSQHLSLDIMEVTGDEDRVIAINLSNQFMGEGSIAVVSNQLTR